MEISRELAKQIVTSANEVIQTDINLINAAGIIIGSTDPDRIGTYHQAGAKALSQQQPVMVTEQERHLFQGTKEGINYPIFLNKEAIAVIGISGKPSEVEKFGFLVTKICEIFLKEQMLIAEMNSENRFISYLVTALIHDSINNPKYFHQRLREFEIDDSVLYHVFSVKLLNPVIEPAIRHYFAALDCRLVHYLYPSELVILAPDPQMAQFQEKQFSQMCSGQAIGGLAAPCSLYNVHLAWPQAVAARRYARRQNLPFCKSDGLSAELVLAGIPEEIRHAYAARVLNQLAEKERQTLSTYLDNHLSLKDTAQKLFIHKNTLQYQLDKITEKCGLNPRIFGEAFLLKLALMLSRLS